MTWVLMLLVCFEMGCRPLPLPGPAQPGYATEQLCRDRGRSMVLHGPATRYRCLRRAAKEVSA